MLTKIKARIKDYMAMPTEHELKVALADGLAWWDAFLDGLDERFDVLDTVD